MSLKSFLPAAAALAVATLALTGCSQTANGSNNHVEGEAISEITINGSANAVEVKSANKVSFTGSNNAVQYEEGNAPQVGSDSGANNVVSKND